MLMKSSKPSVAGSSTAICPMASSYLKTSLAKAVGDIQAADDSIGPDDDDTSPEIWMKNIQQEVCDDDNNCNDSNPNHNHDRYKIYRHLYDEYKTLFKATHKRFHLKILEELYYIQRQKTLRSLILLRHGSDEENKTAKFLWIEYPTPSSSFITNINNDEDIGESKNFPSSINAFPIKDLSKSVVRRPQSSEINIETHITLFNRTTKSYNKYFDSTWWIKSTGRQRQKRKHENTDNYDDSNPNDHGNCKIIKLTT